jgi:hypothetical protein
LSRLSRHGALRPQPPAEPHTASGYAINRQRRNHSRRYETPPIAQNSVKLLLFERALRLYNVFNIHGQIISVEEERFYGRFDAVRVPIPH